MTETDRQTLSRDDLLLMIAFLIALAATLGALFIGEVLGQTPCVLCWYQRIAMFPLAVILGVGLVRNDPAVRAYALPLALAGLAVAVWHSGLYAGVIPKAVAPCTKNGPSCTDAGMLILGFPIPYLSLLSFAGILSSLFVVKGPRT